MAADVKLAGYALTAAQWAAVDPRTRMQLLTLGAAPEPRAAAGPPVPGTTVWPGPDPDAVIIHAAAPRAPTQPPRRARRTSDVD
ncbi:MAG TPA: hypothetical protein VHE35_13930 [Kofleriaceae bacterium]|nr:hypothetical protein [Kofleriaceae bacterium]